MERQRLLKLKQLTEDNIKALSERLEEIEERLKEIELRAIDYEKSSDILLSWLSTLQCFTENSVIKEGLTGPKTFWVYQIGEALYSKMFDFLNDPIPEFPVEVSEAIRNLGLRVEQYMVRESVTCTD